MYIYNAIMQGVSRQIKEQELVRIGKPQEKISKQLKK